MKVKELIVNADDYGLTRQVSTGIRQAHQTGILTSTTAMMNMEGVAGDLDRAQTETPLLGIGVHLTLTAGQPVSEPSQVPSLVDIHGNFHTLSSLATKIGSIDPNQVYKEWRAQIEKMIGLGIHPDHLDSHHHVSYKFSLLKAVMFQLAQEFDLPVRSDTVYKPVDLPGISNEPDSSSIKSTNSLETRFYGTAIDVAMLTQLLTNLNPGSTELMTHPGLVDAALSSKSSYTTQRQQELTTLTASDIKKTVAEKEIRLISFSAI